MQRIPRYPPIAVLDLVSKASSTELARSSSSQICSESNVYGVLEGNRRKIRLLSITESSGFDEHIITRLMIQSFDDVAIPQYVALSYCWGDAPFGELIECNGERLAVTPSLNFALRTLRSLDYNLVWVDQVCINQKDYRERGSQVRLMPKIYSSAAKVLI
jgi:hypothetical protein